MYVDIEYNFPGFFQICASIAIHRSDRPTTDILSTNSALEQNG